MQQVHISKLNEMARSFASDEDNQTDGEVNWDFVSGDMHIHYIDSRAVSSARIEQAVNNCYREMNDDRGNEP